MKLAPQTKPLPPSKDDIPSSLWRARVLSWLRSWEIYLIVLVAAFLRLYRINTTEFDGDQADIFNMAYHAVSHGLQVATSNIASLGIFNPPGIIYILMLPAAFSANPLWAAVMVACLATVAVLLTYVFTRRYYGRRAGIFASLLYATAFLPVFYSRFIWNQNLLLIFVSLFMFALFWGVVERRKGWLFPAIFLLGLLVQLHGSGSLLAAPLVLALLLAPGTVRWRDLVLGIVSLIIIYSSYLLWEIYSHFRDVFTFLTATKQPVHIDTEALLFYQQFLSPYNPYNRPFTNTRSLLFPFLPFVKWLPTTMTVLVLLGGLVALGLALWSRSQIGQDNGQGRTILAWWGTLRRWWTDLRATPYRCGLLVLVVWQIVPLLYLSRHSINLYPHYFIVLMPGPFILIGLLLVKLPEWVQKRGIWERVVRLSVYVLATLIIVAQFAASTANVLDLARGNFSDTDLSRPYYNDLNSLQRALAEADQVAQQHHLKHIYLSTDLATGSSFRYLSGFIHTPVTTFSNACLVLPGLTNGPAVLLIGPYRDLDASLATRFAAATLVDEPKRLGGPPFRLYIVQPPGNQQTVHGTFPGDLQLLDAQNFSFANAPWVVTRWNLLRSAEPSYATTYAYNMIDVANGADRTRRCVFSSMQAGDQLLVSFPQPAGDYTTSINIKVQSFTTTPYNIAPRLLAPLGITFETDNYQISPWLTLRTIEGKDTITIATS